MTEKFISRLIYVPNVDIVVSCLQFLNNYVNELGNACQMCWDDVPIKHPLSFILRALGDVGETNL